MPLPLINPRPSSIPRTPHRIHEQAVSNSLTRSGARTVLEELRAAGIHLSMDDFGIGQSSLTYLKDLPISKMKIDKSFVIGFEEPRNVAIVRSAIDLARNMGLHVTAEGIEDESTWKALRELGCDSGQGYFFSKPLSPEALLDWLQNSPWSPREGGSAE